MTRHGASAFPRVVPPVLRFGAVPLDLAALPQGLPREERLMEGLPAQFGLPALRPFPSAANLLVETPPEGRAAALAVLQSSMFRMLTSLPPGQVRFTIIDPIGIGRNFGAFMHLADFDGALVTNQVWTDPAPDRGAARRSGGAHGDGDPEIPQERIRDHRRIQRGRRGSRRAVSRGGGGRFSGQVRREVGRTVGGDCRRRVSLRRADARRRRPIQADAAGLSAR